VNVDRYRKHHIINVSTLLAGSGPQRLHSADKDAVNWLEEMATKAFVQQSELSQWWAR